MIGFQIKNIKLINIHIRILDFIGIKENTIFVDTWLRLSNKEMEL